MKVSVSVTGVYAAPAARTRGTARVTAWRRADALSSSRCSVTHCVRAGLALGGAIKNTSVDLLPRTSATRLGSSSAGKGAAPVSPFTRARCAA